MKSGGSELAFYYLSQHLQIPDNVAIARSAQELSQSNKQYKIMWALDNVDQPMHSNLEYFMDDIDLIVCISEWQKQQFIHYKKIPQEKIVVISSAVADMFKPPNKPKSKTCIFLSAPHKGIAPLPKIWRQVVKRHPTAQLKVFSSSSLYENANKTYSQEKPEFVEVINELKSLPNVLYSPCIEREELLPHIQDAAFFIHPNVWEEVFCASMVEAMACGCYPIVSDIGALREVSFNLGKYIPMTGKNTPKGWIPSQIFIDDFADILSRALVFFDNEPETFYAATNDIVDITINHYNWPRVSYIWETTIRQLLS